MAQSRWGEWRKPERACLSELYLIFGVRTFGANTTCDDVHHGPIPEGTAACCAVCHRSGIDDDPKLRETAADKLRVKNWEPEGGKDQWGRTAEATVYEGDGKPDPDAEPTRKQKRAQKYGERSVAAESMDPRRLDRIIERRSATRMA